MPDPKANAARAEVGRLAYEINVQQYACAGLNFGTYYDRSPIIAYDGAEQPAYTMDSYTPSTVPGCRTPHLWREDGGSLYDAMGPEFTLLRFDSAVDVAALDRAARQRNVPLKVLDVAPREAAAFQSGRLVLSRPDQHVAWRGNRLPSDPLALIDHVRGVANRGGGLQRNKAVGKRHYRETTLRGDTERPNGHIASRAIFKVKSDLPGSRAEPSGI